MNIIIYDLSIKKHIVTLFNPSKHLVSYPICMIGEDIVINIGIDYFNIALLLSSNIKDSKIIIYTPKKLTDEIYKNTKQIITKSKGSKSDIFPKDYNKGNKKMEVINFYDDIDNEYKPFSNYEKYPIKIDGVVWPTTEHYFHSEKFPDSEEYKELIRQCTTPNKAKILGNQKITGRFGNTYRIKGKDTELLKDIIKEYKEKGVELREDWDDIKNDVMYITVKAKFEQYPKLKALLLSTGDKVLREYSKSDKYWGQRDGTGRNMLGNILMKIRDEFRGKDRSLYYYEQLSDQIRNI